MEKDPFAAVNGSRADEGRTGKTESRGHRYEMNSRSGKRFETRGTRSEEWEGGRINWDLEKVKRERGRSGSGKRS